MAITTYAELQATIATWLERSDLTLVIPDFITLFEAYANRTLRTRQMEDQATLTTSTGTAALPSDYLYWRSVSWEGDPTRELVYTYPVSMRNRFPSNELDVSSLFTVEGNNLVVRPIDDTTNITFRYFKKIPFLSNGNTSNWLLAAHPDAYLFGSLVEAHAYIPDAERAALWKLRRDEACDEIQKVSNLSRAGGPARPYGWIV